MTDPGAGLHGSTARSVAVILAIVAVFWAWGLAVFTLVGDKGPPGWDFSVVPDVPGASPYSVEVPRGRIAPVPPLVPQHVPGTPWKVEAP